MKTNNIYIALLHYPMVSADGTVTTAVTNLDIHDIARVTATYGLGGYLIVHPDSFYRAFTSRLVAHWTQGAGGQKNPDRKRALKTVSVVETVDDAVSFVTKKHGQRPLVVATTARRFPFSKPMSDLATTQTPILLLFGTGGGMTDSFLQTADFVVEPIETGSGYNHLSVRSAVSIFIDRLIHMRNMNA